MTKLKHLALLVLVLLAPGCRGRGPAPVRTAAADSTARADSSAADSSAAASREPRLTYEVRQGAGIYARYCAVCHGEEGKGDGFNAFNLDPRPHDFTDTLYMRALGPEQILRLIREGGRSVNKSPLMPAWGWTLSKSEVLCVADYVMSFSGVR